MPSLLCFALALMWRRSVLLLSAVCSIPSTCAELALVVGSNSYDLRQKPRDTLFNIQCSLSLGIHRAATVREPATPVSLAADLARAEVVRRHPLGRGSERLVAEFALDDSAGLDDRLLCDPCDRNQQQACRPTLETIGLAVNAGLQAHNVV